MSDTAQAAPEATKARGSRKERVGVVVRAKMTNTVIVTVERRVKHRKYKKYIRRKSTFAAHDELGCEEGQRVRIRESRPLSKTKRWRVVEKLAKGA